MGRWHSHGDQVAGSVVVGQMDGIEAIGLATVARLLWNQTRGNYLAVKAIMFEAALQNKTGAGSFIATAGGTVIGCAVGDDMPAFRNPFPAVGLFRMARLGAIGSLSRMILIAPMTDMPS